MRQLIEKNPRNQEVIFPYIGGEEINTSPTHAYHRYVINFGERSEAEARSWGDLMEIVEEKVKPERIKLANNPDGRRRKEYWWQFGRYTPALFAAIAGRKQVLMIARTSNSFGFTFLPANRVFSENIVAFALSTFSAYALLQSRIHEIWVRFLSNTLKDDLQYSPSSCFETFPFAQGWTTEPALEASGKTYFDFRAALMVRNNEGLTKTYNRFHNPDERDPEILKLRNLHATMDRCVLDAYGWSDITPDCEFLLDYEIDEEEWADKKKPWRYRWPDEVRDEVLARLLELNAERAEEEKHSGGAASKKREKAGKKPSTKTAEAGGLF